MRFMMNWSSAETFYSVAMKVPRTTWTKRLQYPPTCLKWKFKQDARGHFFLLCFLFSFFTFCTCLLFYIYCSFSLSYFLPFHFHPLNSSIPSFLSYSSACNGGWISFSVTSSAHFGGQVTSFVYNRLQQDGAWGSFAFVCPRHTDPSWKSCLSSRQMWTCRQLRSCSPGLDPGVPRSRCLLCSPFHWTLIFDMRNPKINLTNMKFLCHKNTGGCYWSACAWLWFNPRVIVDFMCNKVKVTEKLV